MSLVRVCFMLSNHPLYLFFNCSSSGVFCFVLGLFLSSDVTIKGNLLLETSADEQQPESCFELEEYLADLFKTHSSAESKRMRRDLQKVYNNQFYKGRNIKSPIMFRGGAVIL